MITLDIISDPICPWCYIGKANFEKAVEARGFQPFDIFWRPFQLNPDMPAFDCLLLLNRVVGYHFVF